MSFSHIKEESLKLVSSIFGIQYYIYKKEDRFKQKRKGGQRNKKLEEEQI